MMPVTLKNEQTATKLIADAAVAAASPIDDLLTWEPSLPKLEDPVVPKSLEE